MRYLTQIDAPHFCCGVEFDDDIVVLTAPIVKYMMGWDLDQVRYYCDSKRWKFTEVQVDGISN